MRTSWKETDRDTLRIDLEAGESLDEVHELAACEQARRMGCKRVEFFSARGFVGACNLPEVPLP